MPDNQPSDHDLIIEVRGDIKALRADVTEIKDNTKQTLSDHEGRLRILEAIQNQGKGTERAIQGLISVLAVAVVELIIKFLFHL